MERAKKHEVVTSLKGLFEDTTLVVVTHYSGLTVAQMTALRARMNEAGAGVKVTKNRLARLALEGTRFAGLGEMFTGPTAVAYSRDPVAAAKVAVEFAKGNEKLVILGGALHERSLDADGIKALATLPSLDGLRAKLIALITTPAARIVGVVKAPAGQVARVLAARAEKAA